MLRAAYSAHKGTNHFYFEDGYNNSTDASVRLKKHTLLPSLSTIAQYNTIQYNTKDMSIE